MSGRSKPIQVRFKLLVHITKGSKMKKLFAVCLAFVACMFSVAAIAATGEYWEITTKMDMPGMPFAMPATTQKICIGKGNEKDPRQSAKNKDRDCEMTDVKFSGNKTSWKMRCNNNGEVMTGVGEQTTTANSYQGTLHLSGKSDGESMNMTQTYSGKRVGGACDTDEMMKKVTGQMCDTSQLHSTSEWIYGADRFLAKDTPCTDKKAQLCDRVRKDAPSDANTYFSLVQHDSNNAGVQIAKPAA